MQPGDLLCPIGRMRVHEIIPVGEAGQPPVAAYFSRYAGWRFLAPARTNEVVVGAAGTCIHPLGQAGNWPAVPPVRVGWGVALNKGVLPRCR